MSALNVVQLLEYLKTEIETRKRTYTLQKRKTDNSFQVLKIEMKKKLLNLRKITFRKQNIMISTRILLL